MQEDLEIKLTKLQEENKELKTANTKVKQECINNKILLENLVNQIKTIKSPVKEKLSKEDKLPGTIILPLYDLHVGLNVPSGDGFPGYNLETFRKYCLDFVNYFNNISNSLKSSYLISEIVVILGGDLIEGRTLNKNQFICTETIDKQVSVAFEEIRNLLLSISKNFKKVHVFSLVGNHGRLGEWGELDKVEDNIETVLYRFLEKALDPNKFSFKPFNNWYKLFSLYNKNYFITHGDAIKTISGFDGLRNDWQLLLDTKIDVVIIGHHHKFLTINDNNATSICVGNWVGTNKYSASNSLASQPSQTILLSTESNPREILIEYKFDSPGKGKVHVENI